jgi:hypothetical protein
MAANQNNLDGRLTAIILVLLTAAMIPAAWFVPSGWNFIVLMVLMLVFLVVLGQNICGRSAGILISQRKLMSLARFQMVLWTVIILSAYLAAAIMRIKSNGFRDALGITLDQSLLGLMGISTVSLIGSPLIQTSKKAQDPKPEAVKKAGEDLKEDTKEIEENSQGVLYCNPDIKDAALSDMFEGDEVGDTAFVNVAKVQMFFFTVAAALSYGLDLFKWMSAPDFIQNSGAFPVLSAGLIAILGISHAGFLANKATTHTPTK